MRSRFFLWIVFGISLLPARAIHAQTALSLDRFEPSTPGSAMFSVSDPGLREGSPIRFGFSSSYAERPLLSSSQSATSGRTSAVVSSQWRLHWQAAVRLSPHLSLDAALPWVRTELGDSRLSKDAATFVSPANGMGSLRFGGRLKFFESSGTLPETGLNAQVWLPVGDGRHTQDAERARYGVELLLGKDLGHWLLRGAIGRRRQWAESLLPTLQSGWAFSAAVAYRYRCVQIGPEVLGSTAVGNEAVTFARRTNHFESLLGVKLNLAGVTLGASFGPGFTEGPGTPQYRGVFTLAIDPAYGYSPPVAARKPRAVTGRDASVRNTNYAASQKTSTAGNVTFDDEKLGLHSTKEQLLPAPRDDDGDRIPNYADACPAAFGMANNRQEKHGCPSDRDDDDIVDTLDACPDIKGQASQNPKLNGCLELISIQGEQVVLTQQIQFVTGADVVLEESEATLTEIAGLLREHPEIVRVAVDGHTDSVGNAARNLALSRRRAISVVRWLVAHGVDERRLEARGFGPRQPLASNATESGRKQNRRVEFIIRRRSAEGAQAWQEGAVK